MKIKISLTFSLILFSALTYSQWKKSGKNDVFDGNYRSARVIGSGGNFPYTKPILVVNYFEKSDNLNIYIDNAGYSGCDNKVIYLKFDNDETIYMSTSISTDANKEAWFIETGNYRTLANHKFFDYDLQLLEKLKKHNTLDIRMRSDCGESDYKFKLSGSTSAINYVLELRKKGDKKRKKLIEEQLIKKRIKDSIEKRKSDSIYKAGLDFIKKAENRKLLLKKRNDSLLKIRYGALLDEYPSSHYDYLRTKFGYTRFSKDRKLTKGAKSISSKGTLIIVKKNNNDDVYEVVFIKGVGTVQYYVMKDYLK